MGLRSLEEFALIIPSGKLLNYPQIQKDYADLENRGISKYEIRGAKIFYEAIKFGIKYESGFLTFK